ncbi:MAG: hypothetical protein IT375_09675 [Polyangiaceae bacterium]|nr:hypothetical protein [Polyangiaceae bacterium]MCK6533711.1 hypothetical protein [Polyangiaceae bacterium]
MRPKSRHLWVVLLVVLSALVAFAQPKKGAAPKEAEKKAADKDDKGKKDDKAKDDKKDAKDDKSDGGSTPPGAAAADLGEPPPKQSDRPDEKTKPSPLTPRPNEFPDGGAAPAPAEYDRLLGDIAALRARVAALTTTMFKSKLKVFVETDGDNARISKFVVTLDDGVVYVAGDRFSADDEKAIYEHAVAPGHHVLGVEIERVDARGREYKTWQSTKMSIVVPESKTVEARVELEDDSDMAVDFPDDQDGEYELNVKLRAQVAD